MNISVSERRFEAAFKGADLRGDRFRVPLCHVVYPNQDIPGILDEDPRRDLLGGISVSTDVEIPKYFESVDSFSNFSLKNFVKIKEVEVGGPSDSFDPCYLDFDGDGIVSKQDIESIYSKRRPGLKYDLNGDGKVDLVDRDLAKEYIGTLCTVSDDEPDITFYDGVWDRIPYGDMRWAYSVNRLLRREHSNKPLFRVYMPVNYFGAFDFSNPDMSSNGLNSFFDNGRVVSPPGTFTGQVYVPNARLKNIYNQNVHIEGASIEGEILEKDIFWRGSRELLEEDIESFYTQARAIQDGNEILPAEQYSDPKVKTILGCVRVSILYDQSGKNHNGYCTALSNSSSDYDDTGYYTPGSERSSYIARTPIIMALGDIVKNDNGSIALSGTAYKPSNPNPFGFPDGYQYDNDIQLSSIDFAVGNPSGVSYQEQFCPSTEPYESVYMYTTSDYNHRYGRAPFEKYWEGPHDSIDTLQLIADYYGFASFQDIFDEGGRLKTSFTDQISESDHQFQYNRALYAASTQAKRSIVGFKAGGGRVYTEVTGNTIDVNKSGYPFYLANQVPEGAVVDLAEGWTKPVFYENYVNAVAVNTQSTNWSGTKDIYTRLLKDPTGNDYNRSIGFNKYVDDQLILTSLRYHNDNPSLLNPRCDLRLNNKRQLKAHTSSLGITEDDGSRPPARMMMTGFVFKDGNIFYESAAFKYTDEDLYEEVIAEANTYFSTTPLGDSQHAPE